MKLEKHPLKVFLRDHGIGYRAFCRQFKPGLTPEAIGSFVNGKRNMAKPTAERLSKITGISAEKLMFPENYQDC